jgi:hypothetical protein
MIAKFVAIVMLEPWERTSQCVLIGIYAPTLMNHGVAAMVCKAALGA